jgi:multidrug efflux pump subunit AcrA (membrane-fusion protein)
METEVDVPNPNLVLIPGMYAQASLTLDRRDRVLTIPLPAVDFGSDETSGQVVVVTPENRIEMRKVELGLQSENKVEVRSGLRENEIVVTGNRANLRSGQQVRPKASS